MPEAAIRSTRSKRLQWPAYYHVTFIIRRGHKEEHWCVDVCARNRDDAKTKARIAWGDQKHEERMYHTTAKRLPESKNWVCREFTREISPFETV